MKMHILSYLLDARKLTVDFCDVFWVELGGNERKAMEKKIHGWFT